MVHTFSSSVYRPRPGSGSARASSKARDLVSDEVLDYRTTPLSEPGRFDVVLDTVGTRQPHFRRLLAPGGRVVAVTTDFTRPPAGLLASTVNGSGRIRFFSGNPDTTPMTEITRSGLTRAPRTPASLGTRSRPHARRGKGRVARVDTARLWKREARRGRTRAQKTKTPRAILPASASSTACWKSSKA
ncbi:zinc-binding dehydrogenase [Embleya sp. NPDC020886]|uniref:zinc-binding dehydrogenase n=1 Tax=Embleya sp. NPDC020886 TaxID=3363980 RepID=UPI00379A022E